MGLTARFSSFLILLTSDFPRRVLCWPVLGLTTALWCGLAVLAFNRPVSHWAERVYPFETQALQQPSTSIQSINKPFDKSLTTAKPTAAGQHPLEGPATLSVARIEAVLQQYGSPAIGRGQALYDLGLKYNLDPAYALAFFVHESSAGTKGIATITKSLGNIRQTADSGFEAHQGFRKYPTWEAGMEDWYRLIKSLYIEGWQLRTVEAIVPVYAPAADRNNPTAYIQQVNALVEGWRKG